MADMSRASEICRNVWLGPTPAYNASASGNEMPFEGGPRYDLLVEATDMAQMFDPPPLEATLGVFGATDEPQVVEFPSSGSVMPSDWTDADTDKLVGTCRWIHQLANPNRRHPARQGIRVDDDDDGDDDGDDIVMALETPQPQRKMLIHCADGYTETSFLALAYFMYAEGVSVHEAWLRLHRDKQRNFFAYPSDVRVLVHVQPHIMEASPSESAGDHASPPSWLRLMDGSFPSRILPYMYLGNLGHANNPGLLRALGIRQVLSVGEPLSWSSSDRNNWDGKMLLVDRVQDNGLDSLTDEFDRCLEFIGKIMPDTIRRQPKDVELTPPLHAADGKAKGTATLVHCRVGVSRSATICIAEVMKSLGLSFPRA